MLEGVRNTPSNLSFDKSVNKQIILTLAGGVLEQRTDTEDQLLALHHLCLEGFQIHAKNSTFTSLSVDISAFQVSISA